MWYLPKELPSWGGEETEITYDSNADQELLRSPFLELNPKFKPLPSFLIYKVEITVLTLQEPARKKWDG